MPREVALGPALTDAHTRREDSPMPTDPTRTRVFWFDDHKTPNVADVLAQEADILVHRLAFDAPAAENWAVMANWAAT